MAQSQSCGKPKLTWIAIISKHLDRFRLISFIVF
jgi:hypothetical protein